MRPLRLCVCLLLIQLLVGCISSDEQQVRETTTAFWQAVLADDMEAAKQQVTWESVQYLKFIHNQQIDAQRFELGELLITDGVAEVAILLHGGDKGEMKIPVRTVLIRYEAGWLVDVQKTMGSMVNGAMGSVVEQLNDFMQNGLKGLDDSLSESIDQLGKSLEDGLKDFQDELKKPRPLPSPPTVEQKQQVI